MANSKLRLAILTGSDSEATRLAIESLIALPNAEVCGILLDTEQPSFRRRMRNLRRNVRREGISYAWYRIGEAIYDRVESWATRIAPLEEAEKLLRQSFPARAFSLADFTRIHGIPVVDVGNINSQTAANELRKLSVDLGIVLGTRILKRSTFSVPSMGSINLHKGKVPEYRGQPAGFWEIYDGQSSAGVTIHFVDEGLDTGDIVAEATVAIHPKDSPETLRRKLDLCGAELLPRCVSQIAEGTFARLPQPKSPHKARTSPTRKDRKVVEGRLDIMAEQQSPWLHVMKTLAYLMIYHFGIFRLIRFWHGRSARGRGCILLYHRVNNLTRDSLTTSIERFAEHLAIVNKYYPVLATKDLVERLRANTRLTASPVAIHFDDCYRDVFTNAAQILARVQLPACAFVSSGFVDTDRIFPHDLDKCPFKLENLESGEVIGLTERGFEIGAHTVNHVDLGQVSLDEAVTELQQSKRDLEAILGRPVNLVSYPYGRKWNIRPEVVDVVKRSGYDAMFSAYGGYVEKHADLFDIRRIGVSGQHRPLDLLMDIEGISLGALKFRLTDANARPSEVR
jgi:peptidoglycan/xylan/chitin deacetylase (PgdA/CDA1 family)/folate-dependent phosphoribosylglycinamide formyltransferase PurN